VSPLAREALIWIGGAIALALVIAGLFAWFLPELDLLGRVYAVL